jgi:hypothetical protein
MIPHTYWTQAKEKVDQEERRRREEELLAMEKLNSTLNQRITCLVSEIRTLRQGALMLSNILFPCLTGKPFDINFLSTIIFC